MTEAAIQTAIEALEKCRRYQICDEIDKIALPALEALRAIANGDGQIDRQQMKESEP